MIFDATDTIAPAALLDWIGRGEASIVLMYDRPPSSPPATSWCRERPVHSHPGDRTTCEWRSPLRWLSTAGTDLARGSPGRFCDGGDMRE